MLYLYSYQNLWRPFLGKHPLLRVKTIVKRNIWPYERKAPISLGLKYQETTIFNCVAGLTEKYERPIKLDPWMVLLLPLSAHNWHVLLRFCQLRKHIQIEAYFKNRYLISIWIQYLFYFILFVLQDSTKSQNRTQPERGKGNMASGWAEVVKDKTGT